MACNDLNHHDFQHLVEILPDGVIISGHLRVRAAEPLGWTEIDVMVRTDLAEVGQPSSRKT
jgi:hypothetical protein